MSKRVLRSALSNNEMQLTKGAEVRAARHSAGQRRCSMPHHTFFTNVPSQLNAVFGRHQDMEPE